MKSTPNRIGWGCTLALCGALLLLGADARAVTVLQMDFNGNLDAISDTNPDWNGTDVMKMMGAAEFSGYLASFRVDV